MIGFSADDMADYMGVTDESRQMADQRRARRDAAKSGGIAGVLANGASSVHSLLQDDVSAKFEAARREESQRKRSETEVETVTTTTTKKRNIESRHHNFDAESQWGDRGPEMG